MAEQRTRRPWICPSATSGCELTTPCPRCLGARNRRRGARKQTAALRALETAFDLPRATFARTTANEESWATPLRVEVKAGAQVAAQWGRYLVAEEQARRANGYRGTAIVLAINTQPETLAACRLSALGEVIAEWPLVYIADHDHVPAVAPIVTGYQRALAQSQRNTPPGDRRPFAYCAMPPQTADGLLVTTIAATANLANQRRNRPTKEAPDAD